jgi:hemoglobin
VRSLFERIGGAPVIARIVDDFYERLTHDPRVLHHFDAKRLPALRAAQCAWIASTLGGGTGGPVPDLRDAHQHLVITDDQVAAVITHLDAAIEDAGVEAEVRRQVMALVSRLWYARLF